MSSNFNTIKKLNSIGIALSAEKDTDKLIENILLSIKDITNADGGSIYSVIDEKELEFQVIINDSLDIYMGGSSDFGITFPNLKLYKNNGAKVDNMVVACSYHNKNTINIIDVYDTVDYDTSGTLKFDQQTGYRTQSNMTIPMVNHEKRVIGVLQLINRLDDDTGKVIAFSEEDLQLSKSLASQAAVAITNKNLIKELKELFEAFIKTIATAIDDKSPYTGTHCKQVPLLTMALAKAACETNTGPLKSFVMSEEDEYELQIAGWLHDCGKITTPEYVMDKATKLQTIFDRIELVNLRFELKFKDLENVFLKQKIQAMELGNLDFIDSLHAKYLAEVVELKVALKNITKYNIGGEFMQEASLDELKEIANIKWSTESGKKQPLLTTDELYNLSIRKGTLTSEERIVIQNHMVSTIKILESLPFPRHLQNVPEYAGGHHETMDGKGYPKGLKRDEMSVQARVMAIADIFEALTAADRPYKKGKNLTECLYIMGKMKENHHIDPDLFNAFIDKKVYMDYANSYMNSNQIDDVDLSTIPGYTLPNLRN